MPHAFPPSLPPYAKALSPSYPFGVFDMRSILPLVALVAALACPCSANSAASIPANLGVAGTEDVDSVPFPPTDSGKVSFKKLIGVVKSSGRSFTGYISVAHPVAFTVELPLTTGCQKLVHATETAIEHNCTFASNGAFFDMTVGNLNHCIGNIVANGSVIQLPGSGGVNLALVRGPAIAGRTVIGFADAAELQALIAHDIIQGSGWLVRNSASYVNKSSDLNTTSRFVTEKAPRTAVGVLPNGQLATVVVDGAETIAAGLDLFEFADVLQHQFGLLHAINIDGGGSSVAVVNGQIASKPTCVDTPVPICDRAMATIMCARGVLVDGN